jgi:ribA/ribD-fused uncharacterized protein
LGGYFSNWYKSYFKLNGVSFNSGEQYMMYQKAMLFGDHETAAKILNEDNPREQKKLGRLVKNFDKVVWDAECYELVKKGLRVKFNDQHLKEYLRNFKGYQIVEASPEDRIWGIGYHERNAIKNIDNWGENLLGKILTELSNEL